MTTQDSPTMEEKFKALKMEIRAILLSANDGLTPADLDRDFADINGRRIPYQEFGHPSLYHFLDSIADTIEAYQAPNGTILLFPKSSDKTTHMESLIARQRKMPRVGRFGGIIQKPAEECHGTNERRQLITKRLLRVVLAKPHTFMKHADLLDLYEAEYGERLDSLKEFYCSTRNLFDVKLANYFEVETTQGGLWVRLKDSEREKLLASIKVPGGMPEIGTRSQTPIPQVCTATAEQRDQGSEPKIPKPSAADFEQNENQNPGKISSDLERRKAASAGFPRGAAIAFAQAINKANKSALIGASQNGQVPLPPVRARSMSASEASTQARPLAVVTNTIQQGPKPKGDPRIRENIRSVLNRFHRGIEVNVFGHAYENVTGETLGKNHGQDDNNQERILAALQPYADMVEVVATNDGRYVIRRNPKSIKAYVAPKMSPKLSMENENSSWKLHGMPLDALALKLRRDVDICRSVSSQNENKGAGGGDLDKLKEECRMVLRASPTGIAFLAFARAYQEVLGKPLHLAQYGFLSVMDLVENMRDLFLMDKEKAGLILREVGATQAEPVPSSVSALVLEGEKEAEENTDAEEMLDDEERLVQNVWGMTMRQPNHSVFLHELPALYEREYGIPFPVTNLDRFGLRIFEYTDRFSFDYKVHKLEIIAEPEWAI